MADWIQSSVTAYCKVKETTMLIESGTRYYIVDNSGWMFYRGDGMWSIYFADRYFWYERPDHMLDSRNPHALKNCFIVTEDYATD